MNLLDQRLNFLKKNSAERVVMVVWRARLTPIEFFLKRHIEKFLVGK